MKKALTLSIVIPVYNEEAHLRACLDSIARQTQLPDEVIVVDNNSQDKTVDIANSYPFVRIVSEPVQGKVFARNRGFDTAKSDLIGRIDADSRLNSDWVATTKTYFEANPGVAAVTGNCYFYDFPFRRSFRVLHHFVYYQMQKLIAGSEILWGSNMAVTNTAWQSVRAECLSRPDTKMHEDIDLSLHLQNNGYVIKRSPGLVVEVSLRRGDFGPVSIISYLWPWPMTYWANKRYLQAVLVCAVLFVVWLLVLPISLVVLAASRLRNFLKNFFA